MKDIHLDTSKSYALYPIYKSHPAQKDDNLPVSQNSLYLDSPARTPGSSWLGKAVFVSECRVHVLNSPGGCFSELNYK